MAYSYRRRGYRRYRRRPTGRRTRRPIGRRRVPRRSFRRKTFLKRRYIKPTIKAYTTIDRSPNFGGDAVMAVFREFSSFAVSRSTGAFYDGVLISGSSFLDTTVPDLSEYTSAFRYFKVLKTTLVVKAVNLLTDLAINAGVTQLPGGLFSLGDLPTWTGTANPPEQPKTVFNRLNYAGGGGNSMRTFVASGTPLSAWGDREVITGGHTSILVSDGVDTEPTSPWYFYVWAGTNNAATGAQNLATFAVTVYRTVKFYGRKILTQ